MPLNPVPEGIDDAEQGLKLVDGPAAKDLEDKISRT
jgi:hypothetical protein